MVGHVWAKRYRYAKAQQQVEMYKEGIDPEISGLALDTAIAYATGEVVVGSIAKGYKAIKTVPKGMSKTEYARYMGKLGEEAAEITGSKIRIPSLTGKANYRIPDELLPDAGILREIKNVKYQGLTSQIKDFYMYSKELGYKFILETRPDTKISKPLQELIDNGEIIHKIIGQ